MTATEAASSGLERAPRGGGEWRVDGGQWTVTPDRLSASSAGTEWISLAESARGGWRDLGDLVISVSISGSAGAAGISFGAFKDFLVPLEPAMGEHLLQFEIDTEPGTWAFRADGTLMARAWWDSAVETVEDLFNGTLTLKARHAREIEFCKLAVQPLQSPVRISVIMTCYRFAQRLRLAVMGWGHQDVPSGTLEVIVVNPESPDGTHELIAAMAAAYPEVRLRELPVPQAMSRNKGWMLNRAIEASRGDWVWLTDADCIFPSGAAAALLADVETEASLLYGERRHLAKSATDELLAGRRSPVTDFARLAEAAEGGTIDLHPWGYTQIVHRSHLSLVRYREDLDHFSGSDGAFLENCRSAGLAERRCAGLTCLHLSHPFAWNGTKLFL